MVDQRTGAKENHYWDVSASWPDSAPQRAYDLGHPWAPGMPHLPNHPPFTFSLTRLHGDVIIGEGVSAVGDLFNMGGHLGTHIDALSHFSENGHIFDGQPVAGRQSYADGMAVGSIEDIAPILAPAHLVDVPDLIGRDLTHEDSIGASEFDAWFENHQRPEGGSVVLIRTGWSRYWDDNRRFGGDEGLPGVDMSGARWLTDVGVLATGTDTIAYEKWPSADCPVHVHLLVKQGVPIIESMNLEGVAADGIYSFLLIAIPLRIKGGTGSPIRPVALARAA